MNLNLDKAANAVGFIRGEGKLGDFQVRASPDMITLATGSKISEMLLIVCG